MPDLAFLIPPVLMLAAGLGAWSITRGFYREQITWLEHGLNVVRDHRDHLLTTLGHLTAAVADPALNLDRAVADAENAIDGRSSWTRAF
ncbi:hypothetical protein [Nonomuraea gerenzanensis]|uniref:Uncharacterized protein n=1 Tax=Nonomuraea gerenzanensis TaxID=93944 RepID=A0A1M4BKX4_9ACTN|nr:hypothetical protein [Nonomuraea gerenzanensis]UBU10001.1 hypothetical protein LCN96_37370 [Nonomuraea gerenzanensis]SAP16290.1 hypothetical protein BN4615_P10953 [Nonomuraea gerenzanensis]